MNYGHDLKQGILKALAPDPPTLEWFFVSLRYKATGEFAGASIGSTLSGSYWYSLPKDAQDLVGKPGIGIGEQIKIAPEQLPAEQYHNRLLTREELMDILAAMQSIEGTN